MTNIISDQFPRYTLFNPLVPVWCVTPKLNRIIHRFYDTSPFSPSGRYLGLTRLPYENHPPIPGDIAEVVVVDLLTGDEHIVAETRAWDTQLGAQVQWGSSDNQLFYNDLDFPTWNAFGIIIDPFSGDKRELKGSIYMVSPDSNWIVSPLLHRMSLTQPGYGINIPHEHISLSSDSSQDGLYITNTSSGTCEMLVSIEKIVENATHHLDPLEFENGTFQIFHAKWNRQGTRLMLVLRWIPNQPGGKIRAQIITMKKDGTDIHVAIPASVWDKGGHHPNWCPDGETLIMNLRVQKGIAANLYLQLPGRLRSRAARLFNFQDDGMRIIGVRYDGTKFRTMNNTVLGTGHPTLHPNGRHVLTDSYLSELVAFGDGTSPIRLINLDTSQDLTLVRINTKPSYAGTRNELRVDPHPAWDRDFMRIAFNACVDGTRRVYVADLTRLLV